MAKVKPYIITVRYLGVYEDPRPTVDQIANELNIDPLDILIEEATVTPKVTSQLPEPSTKPAGEGKGLRNDLPFDIYDLERNGPTVAILKLLYGGPPRTQREMREATKLSPSAVAMSISRLKRKGRVRVTGSHPSDGSMYEFVK